MSKILIHGGQPLRGRVRVSGRKNAAVALLPAAVVAEGPVRLENVPDIADVHTYVEMLEAIGVDVRRPEPNVVEVDASDVAARPAPYALAKKMRASYYLLGALLARTGRAEVALPGGCDIGARPIDQHIKAFQALGAEVTIEHGVVRAEAARLRGARIYLDIVSVGATINAMLAACRAEGTTVIENAAKEPHVVDVAILLNAMGGRISGAGTDVIKITGVRRLGSAEHTVIPDEIEAATYLMAAAGTRGDVVVEGVVAKHLEPIIAKLQEAGAHVEHDADCIRVRGDRRLRAVRVKTLPYPGFPTDAQQPMTALLSTAEGTSTVTETIFEARFKYVDELKRMGARIRVEGRTAVIEGVERLSGAPVQATDLRAGAALVVAGLMAEGCTEVTGIKHLDRGYERMEDKLRGLGARIERVGAQVKA
ncbi:MAG: UDP-N-acetylglucosamine 1-carboxyvinyltransferase [Clostridia bacterium]|nr:UDP-N-acetylglucosamine 1-carboxyvinyltransferase [Clostridia bacterium]